MGMESKLREFLAKLEVDVVSLNYYGPYKVVLVYGFDRFAEYWCAESKPSDTVSFSQEYLDGYHCGSLINEVLLKLGEKTSEKSSGTKSR